MKSRNIISPVLITVFLYLFFSVQFSEAQDYYKTSKPYTRWWWFASVIDTNDVKDQLDWLMEYGFGGVEIAFVYPYGGDTSAVRLAWLSPEWTAAVTFAKKYAEKIGLGCDFTFGTLWPFGDSRVPEAYGEMHYGDTASKKSMRFTWEHPVRGRVIDHLNREALEDYSARMLKALSPALGGTKSALFCDSWEVETRKIWTKGFDEIFLERKGYDIKPFMNELLDDGNAGYFYDYMSVVSELVLNEFYKPFSEVAEKNNAFTRVQCCGAPADLLTAYSLADVPESEAILFEPNFSRIPSSSALLSSKNIVSAETFTCLYGWKGWPGPGPFQKQELIFDMKLLADALFANGVNMIVWHGMPFNKKGGDNIFYASVHVGRDSYFISELKEFNSYLEKVSGYLRKGSVHTQTAVYLPIEDSWMGVEYPDSLKFPWAWGEYEQRYIRFPEELNGYNPVWINRDFLKKGIMKDGNLHVVDAVISLLYVDAVYLDYETLLVIYEHVQNGLNVCFKKMTRMPGAKNNPDFFTVLAKIMNQKTFAFGIDKLKIPDKIVECDQFIDFTCRKDGDAYYLFFSNPYSYNLKYPLLYGQSGDSNDNFVRIIINLEGKKMSVLLDFRKNQSLLMKVAKGKYEFIDISYKQIK